jgi:hypothetical protein
MNPALAIPVNALVERLRSHERESETIFLGLGDLFARLMAETDRSGRESRRQVDEVLAQAGGFQKRRARRTHVAGAELEAFLIEAERFYARIAERDRDFLEALQAGALRLADLDGIIARVRADSEEMEIVSLNAMTVALKSGANGRAFSVITDELKRLAARTISLTNEIAAIGHDLLESFDALGTEMRELEATQIRFYGRMRDDLVAGFDSLGERVAAIARAFGDLAAKAARVRDPITLIMQRIQLQDIIRQSLDHVILSLMEATRDEGDAVSESDEYAFAVSVAELSTSLLDDVIAKVSEAGSHFGGDIADVVGAVEACEDERMTATADLGVEGGAASDAVAEESRDYLERKTRVLASARRLAERVNELDELFKTLGVLLGRFRNIFTASRIETARNKALSIVSNTVDGMGALTERIETDSGEASALTKNFIKTATAAVLAYAEAQTRDDDRIRALTSRIVAEFGRLETARSNLARAVSGFTLYTPDFIELIGQARAQVDRIDTVAASLTEARGDLVAFRDGALEAARALGEKDPAHHDIANERLRRMIDRFTIFTHKKAAGELADFEVEEGAEQGAITLF